MAEGLPEGIPIPVAWVGLEDVPIQLVNQFVGQVEQQEIILSFGQVAPPMILGDSPEDRLRQAQGLGFVPVRVAARFGLTRGRLQELLQVLQQTAENYDAFQRQVGGGAR